MTEEIKKDDIVESVYGRVEQGVSKDLSALNEKVGKCYSYGEEKFREDVIKIISTAIQMDTERERIKKYAREVAEEFWKEKEEDKKENRWKSKNLWIPIIFSAVFGIIGFLLGRL